MARKNQPPVSPMLLIPQSSAMNVSLLSETETSVTGEEIHAPSVTWPTSAPGTSSLLPGDERDDGAIYAEVGRFSTEEKDLSDFEKSSPLPSPSPWSNSASAPLLSGPEEEATAEDEKPSETPKEEAKAVVSNAEYKIAFSHFLVRIHRSRLNTI